MMVQPPDQEIANTGRDLEKLRAGADDVHKRDWLEEFLLQCERNLTRSVEERMRYGFCYVYKPVLDDAAWRSFDSMTEYRRWCQDNLPVYLGYGAPDELQTQVLDEQK